MSNSSIWSIDRTLSGSTTLSQLELRSNCNEGVFRIPQCSPYWSLTIRLFNVKSRTFGGVLPLCRDTVGIFYSSSQQAHKHKGLKTYAGVGCPHGVMVKAMDCGIIVCEFILQLRYYVHFQANTLEKGMNPPYPPCKGLNSTTTVLLGEWLWH